MNTKVIAQRRHNRTQRTRQREYRARGLCIHCGEPAERGGHCTYHAALAAVAGELRPSRLGRPGRNRFLFLVPREKAKPAVRLLLAGERVGDVARTLGIQPGMVTLLRRAAKLPPQGRGRRRDHFVTMLAGKIRSMQRQGMTLPQVSHFLGIPINRIKKTLMARRTT